MGANQTCFTCEQKIAGTCGDLEASDPNFGVVVLGRVVGAGYHAAVGVRGPANEADGLGTTVEPRGGVQHLCKNILRIKAQHQISSFSIQFKLRKVTDKMALEPASPGRA